MCIRDRKMRLLDEVEDFKADASFHGNKAPHHMMYKLGTLYLSLIHIFASTRK